MKPVADPICTNCGHVLEDGERYWRSRVYVGPGVGGDVMALPDVLCDGCYQRSQVEPEPEKPKRRRGRWKDLPIRNGKRCL